MDAAQGGMAVSLGQMATQRATNAVKQYGQRMVRGAYTSE